MAKGYSRQTLHTLLEKTFGVTNHGTRNNILLEIRKELEPDDYTDAVRFQNHERLDAIIEASMAGEKLGIALEAIDKQNKLAGAYTERREHVIDTSNITIKFKE